MLQFLDTAIAFAVIMLLLSLLITAIVQAISAMFDLRGKNLAKHVEILLRQVYPEFRKSLRELLVSHDSPATKVAESETRRARESVAKVIADAVVRHPALAQGAAGVTWITTRAKAITSDELVDVLSDLASENPAGKLEPKAREILRASFQQRSDDANEILAGIEAIQEKFGSKYPQVVGDLKKKINDSLGKINQVEHGIEQWFDVVMSRSSDLFLRYTRAITVVAAALIAVSLHVDSRRIAQQLYESSELRNSFVKMADATTAQADKIFDNSKRGTEALDRLAIKEKNALEQSQKAIDASKGQTSSDPDSLKKATEEIRRHQAAVTLLASAHGDLDNCRAAAAWLNSQKGADEALRSDLNNTCQEVTQEAMGVAGEQIKDISARLKDSDLKLMSMGEPYKGYHLLGILGTVVLLSFGAPFWFNTLRELVNLKPAIASKLSQQQGEAESTVVTPTAKVTTKAKTE